MILADSMLPNVIHVQCHSKSGPLRNIKITFLHNKLLMCHLVTEGMRGAVILEKWLRREAAFGEVRQDGK